MILCSVSTSVVSTKILQFTIPPLQNFNHRLVWDNDSMYSTLLFCSRPTFGSVTNLRHLRIGSLLLHTKAHHYPGSFTMSMSQNGSSLNYSRPSSPLHVSHLLLCPHPIIIQKYFSCEIKFHNTILLIAFGSLVSSLKPHLLLTSLFPTNLSLPPVFISFPIQFRNHNSLLQPHNHLCPQFHCPMYFNELNLLNCINPVICLFHSNI